MTDEELTIYEVAFHLKMPIYKLAEEMPYEELLAWMAYFEKRPIDWRSDDRAYKILQTQGVKEKPWFIFNSLNAIYNGSKSSDAGLDVSSLKRSTLFSKMLSAKGGDKVNYDQD